MRLFLVRHGVTQHNLEDRYTGQADIAIADLGRQQAAMLGKRLAAVPLEAVVSSDLQRARETARVIAQYHHLPVHEEPDIREVALGDWENCTYAEVAALYPELVKARRWDASAVPPGGESFMQVWERAARAFDRWYALYPRGTVVWVSHGGLIQAITCRLLDIDVRHRHQFRCSNASLSEFRVNADYSEFVRWNDTSHLEQLL